MFEESLREYSHLHLKPMPGFYRCNQDTNTLSNMLTAHTGLIRGYLSVYSSAILSIATARAQAEVPF